MMLLRDLCNWFTSCKNPNAIIYVIDANSDGATQRETAEEFELANLIILADLVTNSALLREESRGAHYREDFPERDDINWKESYCFTDNHSDRKLLSYFGNAYIVASISY